MTDFKGEGRCCRQQWHAARSAMSDLSLINELALATNLINASTLRGIPTSHRRTLSVRWIALNVVWRQRLVLSHKAHVGVRRAPALDYRSHRRRSRRRNTSWTNNKHLPKSASAVVQLAQEGQHGQEDLSVSEGRSAWSSVSAERASSL